MAGISRLAGCAVKQLGCPLALAWSGMTRSRNLKKAAPTLAALADDETIGARRHGLWEALAAHCNTLGSFDLEAATCS